MQDKNNRLGRRVRCRFKGLVSLILTVVVMLGMMPATLVNADQHEIGEVDNYYFIMRDKFQGLFCAGHENPSATEGIYSVLDIDGPDNNGYVLVESGVFERLSGSTLTELVQSNEWLGNWRENIELAPKRDVTVYCGTNFQYSVSTGVYTYTTLELKLDGVHKAKNTGYGEEGKDSFVLPAGVYSIETIGFPSEDEIINFKTLISLSDHSLEVAVGDEETLTVTPESIRGDVIWESADESIATVDSGGKITAVAPGETVITAKYHEPRQDEDNSGATYYVDHPDKCRVKVNKAVVAIPTATTGLKWTGSEQTGVAAGSGYTVTNGKATDVGNYTATVSLADSTKTTWPDGGTEDKRVSWSIAKADGPAAVTGLKGMAPTTAGGSDGKITGVSTAMEYSANTGFTSATACTGTEITGLAAGTYYVRIKETGTHMAGAYAAVQVPAYTAPQTTDKTPQDTDKDKPNSGTTDQNDGNGTEDKKDANTTGDQNVGGNETQNSTSDNTINTGTENKDDTAKQDSKKEDNKNNKKNDKKEVTVKINTKQKNTSVKKLKSRNKSVTITLKKAVKGVKGYEIQYGTDRKFKKNTKTLKIATSKITSVVIRNLSKGRTYFVRVRTYKESKNKLKKTCSKWSVSKKIKVK